MKTSRAWKITGVALLASVLSLGVQAQGSEAMTSSAAAATNHPGKPERAANRALQRKVRAALVKTRGLNASNVSVRARSGAVTLEGTVPTQEEVERAMEVAKSVSGVASVRNALTMRELGH
jgi:hyperosmotically inducible protein